MVPPEFDLLAMTSMSAMRIGAVFPHHEIGVDPGAMRAYAQGVEELGAVNLLIYDHVLGGDRDRPGGLEGPYDKDTLFHEPLTTLAFIAGLTDRIELVTAVLVLSQRQTVLVAKQAAEVAILSGDRLRLGVGVGWNALEFQALGEELRGRGRRQEEQVDLMRRLWSTEDSFSYDGEFHTVDRAAMKPLPTRPIPIWFGGSASAVLDRCARLGDGWIPLGSPKPKIGDRIRTIREKRESDGKSMDDFAIQAQAQYARGNPERWRAHAAAWRDLGATHLAIATHDAGDTDVDGHLARIAEYRDAVADLD
jgi:probable F420-dependent oxidoreductase